MDVRRHDGARELVAIVFLKILSGNGRWRNSFGAMIADVHQAGLCPGRLSRGKRRRIAGSIGKSGPMWKNTLDHRRDDHRAVEGGPQLCKGRDTIFGDCVPSDVHYHIHR